MPPTDTPQHAAALAMMEGADAVSKAGTPLRTTCHNNRMCNHLLTHPGYTYMAGRRYPPPRPVEGAAPEPEPTLEQQRAALEEALAAMDAQLGEHGGPFFLGCVCCIQPSCGCIFLRLHAGWFAGCILCYRA